MPKSPKIWKPEAPEGTPKIWKPKRADAGFPSVKDPAQRKKREQWCATCNYRSEDCCCEWEYRAWVWR